MATVAVLVAYIMGMKTQPALAAAPSGLEATVATTSQLNIGAGGVITLLATSTCTSRVVTTSGSAVMLTMTDRLGQTPDGDFGHLQLASTTIAYDSGLYGCGLIKAYSFGAQVITFSSVR